MPLNYFSGQGKLYLGNRSTAGNPETLRWIGDVADFSFSAEPDVLEAKENYSGNRQTVVRITRELKMSMKASMRQISADNLKLMLLGETVAQAGGSVTNEVIGPATGTLAVGNVFILGGQDVSAVTIKDSTATPKTLTADTNYTLNAKGGSIEILDATTGGPYTLPLKADYTKAAATRVKMFTAANLEYWLRFEGLNTAVSGYPPVIVDIYRVRLDPVKDFGLINDDLGNFELSGSCLVDQTKTAVSDFGQFGRMVDLAA